MSRPVTSDALREAINRAVDKAEKRKSERDSCPTEHGGCGRKLALLTLGFRGFTVMKLCRFCPWTSAASGVEEKRTRLRVVGGKKESAK